MARKGMELESDWVRSVLCYDDIIWHNIINKWMMHLYSAFYCVCRTSKVLYNHVGGGGLSSTTTSVKHPLGWCDSCHRTTAPVHSPHTRYRWRGERVIEPIKCMRSPHTRYRWRGERVIEPIKWMGIIRRPWLIRASGRNLARTLGLHPYSLREVPWDFLWPQRARTTIWRLIQKTVLLQYSVPVTTLGC